MSNERKPHKHAEVIKAWADGKPVQVKNSRIDWMDLTIPFPKFNDHEEYRVKPESVKVRYRVALCKRGNDYYTAIARDEGEVKFKEKYYPDFVKWITGWNEYECPQ